LNHPSASSLRFFSFTPKTHRKEYKRHTKNTDVGIRTRQEYRNLKKEERRTQKRRKLKEEREEKGMTG